VEAMKRTSKGDRGRSYGIDCQRTYNLINVWQGIVFFML